MTDNPKAGEIAEKLTEAQREGLLTQGEIDPDDGFALMERGLLIRDRDRDSEEWIAFDITHLGLAVRAHLLSTRSNDRGTT